MAEETEQVSHVTTSDGVRLHYVEAGAGKPVVMLPGWSQTAAQFKYQLAGLHDRYGSSLWICVDTGHPRSRRLGTKLPGSPKICTTS